MTFSQFVAQQDARNTIDLNIRKYCLELIDVLKENYKQYAIRGYLNYINNSKTNFDRYKQCIAKLENGELPIDYEIETKAKYYKIILIDGGASRHVHAFVNKKTGEVYKPASFKGPAKGVRYNLLLISDREWLYKNADWSGGYLYKR